MKDQLFKEYGYCVIPEGTYLYRAGAIDNNLGAFFAFHPFWAIAFRDKIESMVKKYIVKTTVMLPLLVSHVEWNGGAIGSIKSMYLKYIDATCEDYDDLVIKFKNYKSSEKLRTFLIQNGIAGYLSSMEDKYPIELYLVPNALNNVSLVEEINLNEDNITNSLRMIHIFPSTNFLEISKSKLGPDPDFDISDERDYSVFHHLFIDNN